MFFVIRSSSPKQDLAFYRARRKARLRLTLYRWGPTEILLSHYLQKNYKKTLMEACITILTNARFSMNYKQEIIVTIPNKELNAIAKIITYGTEQVSGSRILKDMFTIE